MGQSQSYDLQKRPLDGGFIAQNDDVQGVRRIVRNPDVYHEAENINPETRARTKKEQAEERERKLQMIAAENSEIIHAYHQPSIDKETVIYDKVSRTPEFEPSTVFQSPAKVPYRAAEVPYVSARHHDDNYQLETMERTREAFEDGQIPLTVKVTYPDYAPKKTVVKKDQVGYPSREAKFTGHLDPLKPGKELEKMTITTVTVPDYKPRHLYDTVPEFTSELVAEKHLTVDVTEPVKIQPLNTPPEGSFVQSKKIITSVATNPDFPIYDARSLEDLHRVPEIGEGLVVTEETTVKREIKIEKEPEHYQKVFVYSQGAPGFRETTPGTYYYETIDKTSEIEPCSHHFPTAPEYIPKPFTNHRDESHKTYVALPDDPIEYSPVQRRQHSMELEENKGCKLNIIVSDDDDYNDFKKTSPLSSNIIYEEKLFLSHHLPTTTLHRRPKQSSYGRLI